MSGWSESTWFAFAMGAALKSTSVLAAGWAIAFLLRRRSAAARHLVWTAAAAAVLALPFLSVSLPAVRIPVVGVMAPFDPTVLFRASSVAGGPAAAAGVPAVRSGASAVPAKRGLDWPVILMLVWAFGAAFALARMLLASASIQRFRRTARPFPDPDLVRRLAGTLGIGRDVEVLESSRGSMPMTFGFRRASVSMPAEAAAWGEERRRMVLLHELAHVRRGDVATHLLARTALSLYWWNPLMWAAWREFLRERERATDDLVLNAGARASEYAGHLLEVARSLQPAPAAAWAAVAMARRSQLEGRLLAILDSGVNRKAPGRTAALAAVLVAAAMMAPFAAIQAQVKSTRDQAPVQVPGDVDATIRAANAQKNHEMLEQAAKGFADLRQYQVAQKLLDSALAIRGEVSGEQSPDYQKGLIDLGDLAAKRADTVGAASYYSKAVALGDTPQAAGALAFLGMNAVGKKDYAGAVDLLQRSLNLAGSGAAAVQALTWMAVARQQQEGGAVDAETLFQRAMAMAEPNSTGAALAMELYARLLRDKSRIGEADASEEQAAVIRKQTVAQSQAQQSQAGVSANAYRVGSGVTAPKLVSKVEPEYSSEARVIKYQGTSLVTVTVGTDGSAHNIAIKKALGLGLDEKAVEAISQWKFQPGTKDGAPVPVLATIEVNFRLF
jgi:TonB family protein